MHSTQNYGSFCITAIPHPSLDPKNFDLVTASPKSNFQVKEPENNRTFHSIPGISNHH